MNAEVPESGFAKAVAALNDGLLQGMEHVIELGRTRGVITAAQAEQLLELRVEAMNLPARR